MGLTTDLHRTYIGTAKKVYGIMEKLRIGKKKWQNNRVKTKMIRMENWHEQEKG